MGLFACCYLLCSQNPRFKGRTYIGFTVNPKRRIRQHNGEITCGACRTKKKRPWDMILCVYGFPTQVIALQFEWAWQHPLRSRAVREAASSMKPRTGISGKIKLVYAMLALPEWRSYNLTINFFSTKYLQYKEGAPPLPGHMQVSVSPFDDLPCYKRSSSKLSEKDTEYDKNGYGSEDVGEEGSQKATPVCESSKRRKQKKMRKLGGVNISKNAVHEQRVAEQVGECAGNDLEKLSTICRGSNSSSSSTLRTYSRRAKKRDAMVSEITLTKDRIAEHPNATLFDIAEAEIDEEEEDLSKQISRKGMHDDTAELLSYSPSSTRAILDLGDRIGEDASKEGSILEGHCDERQYYDRCSSDSNDGSGIQCTDGKRNVISSISDLSPLRDDMDHRRKRSGVSISVKRRTQSEKKCIHVVNKTQMLPCSHSPIECPAVVSRVLFPSLSLQIGTHGTMLQGGSCHSPCSTPQKGGANDACPLDTPDSVEYLGSRFSLREMVDLTDLPSE